MKYVIHPLTHESVIPVLTVFMFKSFHVKSVIVDAFPETGFDTEGLSSAVWPGGETEALTRLERHLERKVGDTP